MDKYACIAVCFLLVLSGVTELVSVSQADYVGTVADCELALPIDENTWATSYDYSGNGNHVTWAGTNWWQTNVFRFEVQRYGVQMDGSTGYGYKNSPTGLNFTDHFTLEVMFKYYDIPEGMYQCLVSNWLDSTHKSYALVVQAENNLTFVGSSDATTTQYTRSNFLISDNTWYHVFLVFDNSAGSLRFYVNGSYQDVTYSYGTLSAQTGFQIGRIYDNTWWSGSIIDFVRIYSRALSDTEIQMLTTYVGDERIVAGSVLCTNGVYPAEEISPSSFSIVQLSDTQNLASYYPEYYNKLGDFLNGELNYWNVEAVVHTGDFVNDADNATEWAQANSSSVKYSDSTAFAWAYGNHDDAATADGYYVFDDTLLSGRTGYLSHYGDGEGTAVSFTFAGETFAVAAVEYEGSALVLAWLESLLDTYSGTHFVVATHSYLNLTGGYGLSGNDSMTWQTDLTATLNEYDNVFMVLSGHDNNALTDSGDGYFKTVNERGEAVWNRQQLYNEAGACAVRLYSLSLISGGVYVSASTYDVLTERWLTDDNNSFGFASDFAVLDVGAETTEQDVNWMAFIVLIVFALVNVFLMLFPRLYVLNFVVGVLTLAFSAATVNDSTLPIQPYFSLIVALLAVLGILRAANLLRNQ